MASSSSSLHMFGEHEHQQGRWTASSKQYDAFISCRGPDVTETLAKQLYELLQARGCRVFLECEEKEWGASIPFAIRDGICSSAVHIPIFSKAYAESSWCLEELVLMLEQFDALFIPVFYDAEPWELRRIENKDSAYAAAFSGYESRGWKLDKLEEWKTALVSASEFSGYEYSQNKDNLCEKIVSRVLQEIERRITPLQFANYPIGLDKMVEDFERSCLETPNTEVKMVGIFGMGGSGKTTLAKELFSRKRSSYSSASFLFNVRESHARSDLRSLQSKLLKDLFHDDRQPEHRLGRATHQHSLIVLDDIDDRDQLDALLPEGMLGPGSLVIVTTRDLGVLTAADVTTSYMMKPMDPLTAEELFCRHAFHGGDQTPEYKKLVESFVDVCGGLPLSLQVLGCHVRDRNGVYWKLQLEKAKKIPPNDIMQKLRISFDSLDEKEKEIFIDIACFFFDKPKYVAMEIWMASQWSTAERSVQTLVDKCLVEVEHSAKGDFFIMHDQLRDLGRHLADTVGSPRLWQPQLLRPLEVKSSSALPKLYDGEEIQEVKSSSALSKLYDGKKVKKRKALYEVASNEVGLDDLVEDFERHCQQMADKVKGLKNNIIGIFGVGGSGKTTVAKQIFSRKRSLYSKSSFLFDVREASAKDDLTSLQTKLLNDLLSENQPKFSSTNEGISYIESVLERSPIFSFLTVIDDVGDISQLYALLPKQTLTSNSLVIVTTRKESVLIEAKIKVRYEIKEMDQKHGRQLFCWHAFRRPEPQRGYEYLVECFVKVCKGSPVSLRVLGGHVFGRSKKFWKLELGKVRRRLSGKIKDVLKISYDSLVEVEKQIFIDIACFFTEKDQSIGIRIWKASGWNAEDALRILRNKRLVEVVREECWNEINNGVSPTFVFRMDNHLRHLGRAMANDGQNQRVWNPQDLKHLETKSFSDILKEADGRCYRSFNSIRNKSITYFVENSRTNSGTSPTLRWLQLNGKDSIPSWVPLQDLEGLRVRGRLSLSLWHQPQVPSQLKELVCKFIDCHYMEKAMLRRNWEGFSKSLGMLNLLESLVLQIESQGNRKDIVIEWSSFEESVGRLNCLRTLGLLGLYINGEIVLSTSRITDLWLGLEAITLSHVGLTSKVSISGPGLKSLKLEHMEDLIKVDLIGVETLKCLELIQCDKLKKVSANDLTQLQMLSIEKCWEIEELPDLSHSNLLQRMRITCCEELQNIRGIQELSWGKSITITCCPKLQSIPGFKYLKGLQYMILSDGGILSFISELQELPSEFTVVMGKAATSFPKADEITGIADALYEFQSREEAYKKIILLSQKTQQLFGAIILCAMVRSDDYGSNYMVEGIPGQTIDLSWAGGKRIYMIVVTGRRQISSTKIFGWMPTSCKIEKGYLLAVNEGQELKTLTILKRLTEQLCKTDAFN
ncbi:disease resistance protein RUN1-like [Cryptomeria japonica]|uniref:disease resistance protein RUN1-like n=1 Tax=Cryptomeria japonica TaxID=3369 RepID=UPI0027D9EE63|nr:disease resistance protein RUN1-like [Cryptomeria japonica]